jgi:Phosphotransferase enzyme family
MEVRPVFPDESLAPIFQLIYTVYVDEKRVLNRDDLAQECQNSRGKWDEWDTLPGTRHFVALSDGAVVGHTRVVNDSSFGVPLERTGFDLTGERALGRVISEFSKLIIRSDYRGGAVLLSALLWQVYHQKKVLEKHPSIYFSCDPSFVKVYQRMGAAQIGAYFNREFKVPYAAMRMSFGSSFNEHVTDGPRMHMKQHASLSCVSTDLLQQCADDAQADVAVDTWQSESLASGGADVAGVWRVSVSGKDSRGGIKDWSCIAKTILKSGDARSLEVTTYLGGSPLRDVARLRMPDLLELKFGHGADTLILEDVHANGARELQVSDIPDLAQQLGTWHAAGAQRNDNIGHGWLRKYVRDAEPLVAALAGHRDRTPLLEGLYAEPAHTRAMDLWGKRKQLLDALDALPHTYSHQDLVAGNVAVREAENQRIYNLLDWGNVGISPFGAELAPLLVGSAILMCWDIKTSGLILDEAIDAYRQGLLSKRVCIGVDTLRLSFTLTSAVRYLAWCGHRVGAVLDPAKHIAVRRITKHSLPEVIANYTQVRDQLIVWAELALSPAIVAARA